MEKLKISVAGIPLEIHIRDPKFRELFSQFQIPHNSKIELSICPTEKEIESERKFDSDSSFALESSAILRLLSKELLKYDVVLVHGVSFSFMGKGYLLTAKSGVGKTTHFRYLKEHLKEDIQVINGDKTFIRMENGIPVAYPSPFGGKEGYVSQVHAPLASIIVIERGEADKSAPVSSDFAFTTLAKQVYLPEDFLFKKVTLGHLLTIQNKCSFYKATVSNSIHSVLATLPILEENL